MIKTMQIVGRSGKWYTVVAPTLWHGHLLSQSLEEYFPDHDIDGWFAHGERWRKQAIGKMWGEECVVTGHVPADTHEIINQGMGERGMTLVPWNMIRLNHIAHVSIVHSYKWQIAHWDPLAWPSKLALVILDSEGRSVRCWYNLPYMQREREKRYR